MEERAMRFWPRKFWQQALLVVVIVYIILNLILLTADTGDGSAAAGV
jgi:hypothetical protein